MEVWAIATTQIEKERENERKRKKDVQVSNVGQRVENVRNSLPNGIPWNVPAQSFENKLPSFRNLSLFTRVDQSKTGVSLSRVDANYHQMFRDKDCVAENWRYPRAIKLGHRLGSAETCFTDVARLLLIETSNYSCNNLKHRTYKTRSDVKLASCMKSPVTSFEPVPCTFAGSQLLTSRTSRNVRFPMAAGTLPTNPMCVRFLFKKEKWFGHNDARMNPSECNLTSKPT